MTRDQVASLMALVAAAFPHMQDRDLRPTLELWHRMLADLDFAVATKAVRRILATSRHWPTIAEIRRAALEEAGQVPPDVDAACEEFRRAARSWTPYAPFGHEWSHPLVRRAAEIIGLDTMALTEQPTVVASHFRAVYERLRQRAIEDALVPRISLDGSVGRRLGAAWTAQLPGSDGGDGVQF